MQMLRKLRCGRILSLRARCCAVWTLALLGLLSSGCKSGLDVSRLKHPFGGRSDEELASTENTRGPLERILQASAWSRKEVERARLAPPEAVKAYEDAERTYNDGNFDAAEKQFKSIAKKYKDTQVEEDALFMIAETHFAKQRYSKAQDGYDELVKRYPSTRYMTKATQRWFEIARVWLRYPGVVTSADIQQVDYDKPSSVDPPKPAGEEKQPFQLTRAVPILPNLTDRSRPVFDTEGRALQSLRSIWLNDPTGPLADDALMMTASYHLRNGDYMEADRFYGILREQYPRSKHLENAFILGSHVKLMSYQGSAYDGKTLEDASKLKESTLRLFPDNPQQARQRDELRRVQEAKAGRDWEMVRYYEKKKKYQAVAVYCREIIKQYPNTAVADQARQKLAQLTPEQAGPYAPAQNEPSLLPSGTPQMSPLNRPGQPPIDGTPGGGYTPRPSENAPDSPGNSYDPDKPVIETGFDRPGKSRL